jgi:hypothetical protein
VLLAAPSLRASGKRAVLVGINDYTASHLVAAPGTPPPSDGREWEDLEGAVTDVGILREMLVKRYSFDPANIVTLVDQQATRAAILDALAGNLLQPSKSDDVVLFYYSGHGSQVANSCSDELDLRDESIIPADSRLGVPDIRDKELRRLFNAILDRGTRLTIIVDSCHSGSGVRGFDAGQHPRSVKPDLRDVADAADAGPRPENRGALVLASSQDFDLAYELRDPEGKPHGAFSWALENALLDAPTSEPAIDVFRRAQARLRVEMPVQEPVIAGDAAARLAPFVGARGELPRRKASVAVERVDADGAYVLQGGWVNGITVGSQLEANGVRLEVKALRGISRCEARAVAQPAGRTAPAVLGSGTLLDVVGWAAPPGRALQVWMPVGPMDGGAVARELQREAGRRKIRWIADPTETAATHLLRWRGGRWELLERGGRAATYVGADAKQLIRTIPSEASLFVQLPAPPAFVDAVDLGVRGAGDGVTPTSDPRAADYILVGRYVDGRIEYAWLRRDLAPAERGRDALPSRSRWSALGAAETPPVLADAVMRLRRVFGWQHLASPEGAPPFALAVRAADDGSLVTSDVLVGQRRYGLVLRARSGRAPGDVHRRYAYVFVVDSFGNSILLFPLSGSVENRVPFDPGDALSVPLPDEVTLGDRASFVVKPPYGLDTYFLLTTDDALPDPWSLEWDGVRGVHELGGRSPLQTLLQLGGVTRSPLPTPANWSIEKLTFQSVPPPATHAGRSAMP